MPVDEVLMRDSCGKSRSKLKKYFYYNEYNKDNFPFQSDYEELTLLDLLEGKKSIIDVIPIFIPYALIIILAIICVGIWISICSCSRKPKCFLKKDNIHTHRTRFICLMVFFGFALCIIVLGIITIVYVHYAEGDFNGTICSLLMFQYEIINGQGFLARNHIYKPYWYGSTEIGKAIENINTMLSNLKQTCDNHIGALTQTYTDAYAAGLSLEVSLESIYTNYKDSSIDGTSPTGLGTVTIPIYISNLGPKENNETYTGRIYEGYNENFKYILDDILTPVTGLCTVVSGDAGQYLTNGLGGFESVIENLDNMLGNLSSTITEYITEYSNYIVNFGFKVNFSFNIIMTVALGIEVILFVIYYFRAFSFIKYNIYIFIHIINISLILCIIYSGIFGILGLLMGNMADIVDAALSKENLSSENPRLIDADENIKKLARCLRGDGNLFEEFVTEDVKKIINPLNMLYFLYTPVKTVTEKITNATAKNQYNSLIAIDEVIKEFEDMEDDFILSTTKETSNTNDINTILDEMATYTMAGRRYQQQNCAKPTYDIWTTNSAHCPYIQADANIVTGNCKYLKDHYDNGNNCGDEANAASSLYNQKGCHLITDARFSSVEAAVEAFILTLCNYRIKNSQLINTILDGDNSGPIIGLKDVKDDFEDKFIDPVKNIMPIINDELTSVVYNLFSKLLNDTTKDTSTLNDTEFSLFSWMNCTAIGQDYNATLSTLKSNLTSEMKVITFCSLVCEFLLIANLYIMVGLAKNLRDKIFEINDARNVSHSSDNIEELQINSIKETKNDKEDDEIFAIKNKKKFEVAENIDQKRGIDVKEGLDKDGNGITHPNVVSINGPDGRCIFENGENGENIHTYMEMENNKKKNDLKEKETEDNGGKLKIEKKVEKKNLPSKKKDILDSDDEKTDKSDDESSRKTKTTKNIKANNAKSTKSINKLKSSKNLDKKDKKSSGTHSSSSVSFG